MPSISLKHGALGVPVCSDRGEGRTTRKGEHGVVMFGPYEDRAPGRYRVDFYLGRADDANVLGDPVCAKVEIVTNEGTSLVAERLLLLSNLRQPLSAHSVEFTLHEPRTLEYRIVASGQVALEVGASVEVEALPALSSKPAALGSRERRWLNEREFLDGFLRNVGGLIHVGANLAQERRYYWLIGVDVLWVEAIPELYARVVDNVARYPKQRAVQALLTEREGEEVAFRIANNNGGSSSILPLEDISVIWPDIQYVETRTLVSTTLDKLMERENIATGDYQALTLDVEGAELMVLKGASDALRGFEYVKCEVADFPARTGTPSVDDLDAFLGAAGFAQLVRRAFATGPGHDGTYWDIVWKRVSETEPLHEPGYELPIVVDPGEVSGIEKCE